MQKTLIAGLAMSLAGCRTVHERQAAPTEPAPICTMEARPGIVVSTQDSLTGLPLMTPAAVTATDASYTEHGISDPPRYYLAYERPGTYAVTVQMPGYARWARTVAVTADRCHVITLQLSAQLTR